MLDAEVKRRIDAARDTLVGQVPDPLGQVRHITAALMHRFMSDRDRASIEKGGEPAFFIGEFAQFAWDKILNPRIGGKERVELYHQAVEKMAANDNLPDVFREMFRGAFVSFKDPRTLFLFLQEVDNLPARSSEDLGNAFEYILSILGTQGQAGQFRTPRHIIEFITETVAPQKGERILDPACGSAGFLIAAHRRILRENSSAFRPEKHQFAFTGNDENATDAVYSNGQFNGDNLTPNEHKKLAKDIHGYDISPDMIRLSLVNMFLHQNRKPEIHAYDTLTSHDKWDEDFEVILANPPFMSPRGGIHPHGRFSIQSSRSEVLFVDYILEHLTSRGRAGIIVPEGIVSNLERAHMALRKNLVENGLRAVVSLPSGIFKPYSGVKTSVLFVDREQARNSDEILLVRVENDGYDLGDQRRRIDKNDLPAAHVLLRDWARGVKTAFSPLAHLWVKREIIASNGEYNLTAERYRPSKVHIEAKWTKVQLGEICEIVKDKPQPFPGEKRYYDTGAINTGRCGEHELVSFENRPTRANILPQKGDVGFAAMKNTAKVVLIDDFYSGAIFSTGFCFLRLPTNILPAFLFHLIADERFQRNKDQMAGDGIMGGIRKNDVAKLEIPLPPVEFQQELAAELDGYQRVIDGARQVVESWRPQISANLDWRQVKIGDMVSVKSPPRKIPKSQFGGSGRYPIIDQSQNEIAGWSDDEGAVLRPESPVVIFGDHTCAVKLAREPFIQGADGIKILEAKTGMLPEFLYYFLLAHPLETDGYRRHFSLLKRKAIPIPSLKVQREIVSLSESERKQVESCRELIESHTGKIRARVGEIWGA